MFGLLSAKQKRAVSHPFHSPLGVDSRDVTPDRRLLTVPMLRRRMHSVRPEAIDLPKSWAQHAAGRGYCKMAEDFPAMIKLVMLERLTEARSPGKAWCAMPFNPKRGDS